MKSRSPRLLIFFVVFIDLLGFGIVLPIASYIADDLATSPRMHQMQVGALMASYSLCQMIFAPMWGRLSDRFGRRPIILLSLFGSVASYTIFGLATSYSMLLSGRILSGICGANITAAQAYIADVTEAKKRTAAMGLIGMAFGMGFAIGPVFGGVMALVGERISGGAAPAQLYPGLTAAAICLANLLWAAWGLPESLPPEKRGQAHAPRRLAPVTEVMASLTHRTIGPLVGVFFLSTLAFANLEVMFGIYAKHQLAMTTAGIYGVFVYIGLLLTFMHGYVVRKMVKFIPEPSLVVLGTLAQAAALGIFPLFPSLWGILLSMAILSFGQGICVPSLLALVSQSTSAQEQGHVMGITQSASSMGRIVGPLFATSIWKALGLSWPFYIGAVIMLGAVAMAVVTRRRLIEQPIFDEEIAAIEAETGSE